MIWRKAVVIVCIFFFGCEGILPPPTIPETVVHSVQPVKLYVNTGYSLSRRQVMSMSPRLKAADIYLYYDETASGDKVRLGHPIRECISALGLSPGTVLSDILSVPPVTQGNYVRNTVIESDEIYGVFTEDKYYAVLHIHDYVDTGVETSRYIIFTWQIQKDGTSLFQ